MVKDYLLELLSKVGVNLDITLSDGDLRYILWKSYNRLSDNAGAIEVAEYLVKEHTLKRRFKDSLTSEEFEIVSKAKSNGTFMKAPNGQPTNLNERQWIQVRSKAFCNP